MIPKKAETLIPEVAKKCNISEEIAEDIIISYWKEVKNCLNGFTFNIINLTGLGKFNVKWWKLEEEILNSNKLSMSVSKSIDAEQEKLRTAALIRLHTIHEAAQKKKNEIKELRSNIQGTGA